MHSWLSVLCLLTAFCGAALAWYGKYDNAVYGGWTPNRRSPTMCVAPDGKCLRSQHCCNGAKCIRDSSYGFGRCMEAPKQALTNFGEGVPFGKFSLKKADEECQDSFECWDQCCRLIRMGRMGVKQTCGKPKRYICVGRHTAPQIENEVFGNY